MTTERRTPPENARDLPPDVASARLWIRVTSADTPTVRNGIACDGVLAVDGDDGERACWIFWREIPTA